MKKTLLILALPMRESKAHGSLKLNSLCTETKTRTKKMYFLVVLGEKKVLLVQYWFFFTKFSVLFCFVLAEVWQCGRQTTNLLPMAELSVITGCEQPNQFPRLLIFLMGCLFY